MTSSPIQNIGPARCSRRWSPPDISGANPVDVAAIGRCKAIAEDRPRSFFFSVEVSLREAKMAKTMKAAVVHAFGKPLTVEEVPIPTPAHGEVLIKVVANGVCHTDLHAANGDWAGRPN